MSNPGKTASAAIRRGGSRDYQEWARRGDDLIESDREIKWI